ncbi:MAG: endonuclease [Bacteroidales bacterium]|nr:endonuclease [Bacteroidales bacterium]
MKKIKLMLSLLLLAVMAMNAAEQPAGYYKRAEGYKQKALLSQLCTIISANTKVIAYDDLFDDAYPYTDAENGYFIDMYSNVKYSIGDSRINKSYSKVGQSVNREHSFPQSWFSERSPMKSDLFHVYPTDGYVNNQRSSYPYGECEGGTRLTNGEYYGKGRLGNCTAPGYSGKVWEPDDEYKGDFARTYFYMATRYNTQIANWNGNGTAGQILDGTSYPVYKSWYLNLMLKWHRQDPVSEKEIKRNNAAFGLQNNRNPYIDHPELVEYIWGDKQDLEWYEGYIDSNPIITLPTNGSIVDFGTVYTGSTATRTIEVKGRNLTDNLTIALSGEGFSTTTTTITVDEATAGATVAVVYNSNRHANAQGTLSVTSGTLKSTVTLKARAIDMMEADEATEVTPTSFKASWLPVEDVQSYTLYVSGKGVAPPPSGEVKLLLDEDLSDGTTDWTTGGATYSEKTSFRLGTGSSAGSITSPAVDLSATGGLMTVLVDAAAYGSDTDVQMKMSVLDAKGTVLESKTVTVETAGGTYVAVLHGDAEASNKVKIESLASKKRILLTRARVYSGDASTLENAPRKVVAETGDSVKREITGITETSYVVKNLAKFGTFKYQVKAVYNDGTESAYSEPVAVTLEGSETLPGDVDGNGTVDVSDVTALINKVLGSADFPVERCDVDGNGKIDVSDVTALINLVLV